MQDENMQNENMKTVGAYLKKNRELRGISLEEIASSTKINLNILSYLESDRFDKLPSPVFVRGFIRTYLKYLGVDSKEAILFYELITHTNEPAEDKINKLTEKGSIDSTNPKEKINTRVLVASVALAVIFASLITYYFATNKSANKSGGTTKNTMIIKMLPGATQQPVVQPQGITLTPAADPVQQVPVAQVQPATIPTFPSISAPAPAVQQSAAPQSAAQEYVPLQKATIKANKDVWLKVKLDDSVPFDFLLRAGNVRNLEAKKEIKILLGDASAATVEYQDQVLTDLGKEGNTRTIVFPGLGRWKDAMLH